MQKKKKAVILTKNLVPYPTTFGTAIQAWSFVKTLIERGYEVHLCCFAFDSSKGKMEWNDEEIQPVFELLESEGIVIHLIDKKESHQKKIISGKWEDRFDLVQSMIHPNYDDIFEADLYREEVFSLLEEIAPDFVCAWSAYALSILDGRLRCPKIAVTTDLIHLARRYRREMNPDTSLSGRWHQWAATVIDRNLPKLTIDQLKPCDLVFNHAYHHAKWLQQRGLKSTQYYPIPVLDFPGEKWEEKRKLAHDDQHPFRITLIGNVTGVATLSGLHFFANEVMPELEKRLSAEDYEIHVIGGGELEPDLLAQYQKPNVKLRGYVEDVHAEYLECDIFLVPTTIELGFRTRISEAFSFGCCVVAHSSNQLGMPELSHGKNCLISSTGEGIAKAIADCFHSQELREKLGYEARMTYEKKLDGSFICNNMVDAIEELLVSKQERSEN